MSTLKRNGRQQSTISDVIEEIEDDTSADDDSVKSTKSEDQEKEVRKALKEAFEDTEQTLNKQLVLDIQTAFEVLDLEGKWWIYVWFYLLDRCLVDVVQQYHTWDLVMCRNQRHTVLEHVVLHIWSEI